MLAQTDRVMSTSPDRAPRRGRLSRRRALVLAAVLFLALFGATMSVMPFQWSRPAPAAPAVDPRLVIHARTLSLTARLGGGLHASGNLYPAIPGRNTLLLAISSPAGAPLRAGHVEIVATMPGMAMAPIRATLTPRGSGYSGAVTLPMFGAYITRVTLATRTSRYAGSMTLTLPLPVAPQS